MKVNDLQKLSQPVVNVYLGIEEQMLTNIAKRLGKRKGLFDNNIESWQSQALQEMNSLSDENLKYLASQSGLTKKEVTNSLKKAGYGALVDQEETLKKGSKMGKLDQPVAIKESAALVNILSNYDKQALEALNLVNTTMLDQSQQVYRDIINKTTGQVMSGASTSREALRSTIREYSETGVPALIDRAGRTWSTEAYVGMVIRSTNNNVVNMMQEERMKEYGLDLVEVSSHEGARELCEPYQGKIYSLSGKSNEFTALSDTSIGLAAGLFGINCGHIKYPFIDGISEKTYEPTEDKAENDRIYKESQKQRYLERQIRSAKRETTMLENAGDKKGSEIAHRKMLDRQGNMRKFINDRKRTRRYAREQIS